MPEEVVPSSRLRTALAAVGLTALIVAVVVAGEPGPRPLAAVTGRAAPIVRNGAARTPPMGWNTWNSFGCAIDENLVRTMADAIVLRGLRDLGYRYVVVDDCWFDPHRDSAGNLQAAAGRFPHGMRALGAYLHARGLKFGLYQAAGTKTCAQRSGAYPGATGSGGHEAQDARQFAAWGVDYLKYDWCSPSGGIDDQVAAFATMGQALVATGRQIVFSINPNSFHALTGPERSWADVANLWRTTEDITNAWDTGGTGLMGVRNIVDANVGLAAHAGPGGFNDPDMLEVGRGGLSDVEMRSHFALWAMMAAPLMAGNDLRVADAATMRILTNSRLIAVDQDGRGLQAVPVDGDSGARVLVKRLSDGDVAVALFNEGQTAGIISTTLSAVGLSGRRAVLEDAWTGVVRATSGAISASVPAHGTVVYRVRTRSAGGSPGRGSSPRSTGAIANTADAR